MGAKFDEKPDIPDAPETVEQDETPKVFGDPKSYEHLPMEERKAMTQRMKANFFGLRVMTEHLGDPVKRKREQENAEPK